MSHSEIKKRLTSVFQKTLEEEPLGGASLALYHRGEKILSLYGGWKDAASTQPWEADTITLVWSAGKGIGVACLLHALQENQISLDRRVAEFWPEFAQAGKEKITIAQFLSHRAGLAALDQKGLSLTDHEAIVQALAAQPPNWSNDRPFSKLAAGDERQEADGAQRLSVSLHTCGVAAAGSTAVRQPVRARLAGASTGATQPVAPAVEFRERSSHGYGARTFGFLIDELLRRITGVTSLSNYWLTQFADPLKLDLWFGIPEALLSKTADVIPAKTAPPPSDFGTAYADPSSLTRRAFMEPGGNFSTLAMNQPALRQASIISSGAISTADALAKFYSLLATQDDTRYFNSTTRRWMETPMTSGQDRVFLKETIFSAGFMMSGNLNIFPSQRSFGHPGAGGATAFAIPEAELGFAFLPNAMHHGLFSGSRTQRLIEAFA